MWAPLRVSNGPCGASAAVLDTDATTIMPTHSTANRSTTFAHCYPHFDQLQYSIDTDQLRLQKRSARQASLIIDPPNSCTCINTQERRALLHSTVTYPTPLREAARGINQSIQGSGTHIQPTRLSNHDASRTNHTQRGAAQHITHLELRTLNSSGRMNTEGHHYTIKVSSELESVFVLIRAFAA